MNYDDVKKLESDDPKEFRRLLSMHHQMLDGRLIRTRTLASYTPEPVKWIWRNRIPRGAVSILAGDPDDGKTFTTMALAAALTRGTALPDSPPQVIKNVLVWNGEDSPAHTLYQRAQQAGADLTRIDIVEGTVDLNGTKGPFTLLDLPLLAHKVREDVELGLVVLDPASALLGAVDSHRDTAVRGALQPLAELATESGVAVLLVMHLNKGDDPKILYRLSGSIAFGALARSVMFLGTHETSGRKSIDCIKHNLAPENPVPVEFVLNKDQGFQWVGLAPELTAKAIMASRRTKVVDSAQAEELVKTMLGDGAKSSHSILRAADQQGIKTDGVWQAKKNLDIRAKKVNEEWFWELPAQEDPDDILAHAANIGLI